MKSLWPLSYFARRKTSNFDTESNIVVSLNPSPILDDRFVNISNSIPYEELGRRPPSQNPGPSVTYRLQHSIHILGLDLRYTQSYCLGIMRIAACHHSHAPSSGLQLGPPIGQPEEMLGVVNLHRISIRNPANGVPERMIRMRNIGNDSKETLLTRKSNVV